MMQTSLAAALSVASYHLLAPLPEVAALVSALLGARIDTGRQLARVLPEARTALLAQHPSLSGFDPAWIQQARASGPGWVEAAVEGAQQQVGLRTVSVREAPSPPLPPEPPAEDPPAWLRRPSATLKPEEPGA